MDEELKAYLGAMEARMLDAMETRIDTKIDARLDAAFERFSQHILHEMGERFTEVDTKLTSIDARLKLQAGLIQSGSRALARFSEFSENSEARWVDLAARVAALEKKAAS